MSARLITGRPLMAGMRTTSSAAASAGATGNDPADPTNTDEYLPEAQTIVIRLPEATSPDDAQRIVHEEFVRWFDPQLAGPVERYRVVAESIWGLWTAGAGRGDPTPA
jgi:hypothetical protein